jgi:hypothetical protein
MKPCTTHPQGVHNDGRHRLRKWAVVGSLVVGAAAPAWAELNTTDEIFTSFFGRTGTIPSVTAAARLDFTLNIEKMIFLRVGTGGSHTGGVSGAGPAASGTVSTVSLELTPTIPSGAATPLQGSNQGVSWNAGLPTFLTATPVVIPVEVRSNAGQVKISGEVTAPLASGADTIPMSSISISSSDSANLPAPLLPASGTGTPVNVAPGGAGTAAAPTLLTYRTANWSFGFAPTTASLTPGNYTGSVTFTATSL